MVDLIAKTALADGVPVSIGGLLLSEPDLGALTSVMVFNGQEAALNAAFQKAHGIAVPTPGTTTGAGACRAIWFGRDQFLLVGPEPDTALMGLAAISDQSDAWACVELSGPDCVDVLARLVPVDLRLAAFGVGATARSQIGHMTGSITRVSENRFLMMVFRSMAETLVHDLSEAMDTVVARR